VIDAGRTPFNNRRKKDILVVSAIDFPIEMKVNKSRWQILFATSVVAAVMEFSGALLQMSALLDWRDIKTVFDALNVSSSDKVNFALYLTLAGGCLAVILWAGATMLRGFTKRGGILTAAALLTGLLTLALPALLIYPYSSVASTLIALSLVLMAGLTYLGMKTPGVEVKERLMMKPLDIAMVAVFSALTAVVTGTTGLMLPSPTGGYTNIGDTIIFVAALLFGVRVGGLVGIIGPVVADLFVGYPRWFVTVLAHGSEGFIAGLGRNRSIAVQTILVVFGGFVMASVYFLVNVFIKGYPVAIVSYARDLFGQALVSIVLGLVLTKAAEKALPSILH